MSGVLEWLGQMRLGDWLAVVSALIAALSFALSRVTVRRQQALQLESFRFQQDNALIAWANSTIAVIADAQRHCRDVKNGIIPPDERPNAVSELRTRLSVALDSGRLFFPNHPAMDDDANPSPATDAAYAGQTHAAIDALAKVYRAITDLGRAPPLDPAEAVRSIVAERRRFVSEVFHSVDPRRRTAALDALAANRTRSG